MSPAERIVGYRCVRCGAEYPAEPFCHTCAACGHNLDVVYDYAWIGRHWSKEELARDPDLSLWRYLPLLPVPEAPDNPSIRVGGTPLVTLPRIAGRFDLSGFFIKDDTRNPSGSLKDRATEIGLRHAAQLGMEVIVAASTGNAAASLASLAAFYGRPAVILAPSSAPVAKLTQILQYGALLCPINGDYDDAFDLSVEIAEVYGWYSRSTGMNPVLSEGKKTVALEVAEQLGWQVPDQVFVPVGDGCIIGGVYKGFYDLQQLGWIAALPRIVAVQAQGSAAIVNALESGGEIAPVAVDTIADSIAVARPRDGLKAVRAVRESGGYGIRVTDEEILRAQHALARATGIFAEPAAAAAFAGFQKAAGEGRVQQGESVVVLITGSGLKDIPAAQKVIRVPSAILPQLEAFRSFIRDSERKGAVTA